MIAALYVEKEGCYFNLPNVDPWDEDRDARKYKGPYPIVAHPPCARWGRYWSGGPSSKRRFKKGDDGGCFLHALQAVRKWGGVLEHPAESSAWEAHGLAHPPKSGGWIKADDFQGYTCHVEQGHYGHRSRKPTWLYSCKTSPPSIHWGVSSPIESVNSIPQEPRPGVRASRRGILERMSRKQRLATPIPFRDLLITIANSVNV